MQVIEDKNYPWPGASNVKFPLLQTAAVQFHARSFPALLGNSKPVMGKVIGSDPAGLKRQRGNRVSTYMSYQVLEHIEGWVDDMDRLLFILPFIGSVYKKTYYSEAKRKNCSELVHPRDLIINYDALDIQSARKTHRIWKYPNKIKEFQRRGLYREFEGDDQWEVPKKRSDLEDEIQGKNNPGIADEYSLQELYEVHCLWDFDNDGYLEPYIFTLRESDGKIFRIVANYDDETIEYDASGEIIAIEPIEYFTHYYFLPDPESKTHGVGLGTMVGPINEAVNTMINQLTDAGTLSNLQGGFLARGIRAKGGALSFQPGEWKPINTTGDDLRKGIFPMPVREPSMVLFNLLSLLIDAGKDLTSVQDIMVGRNPGQNQPYSTSREVIEQGMKVFNGIYKRLYRSMTSEFKKLFALNRRYLDVNLYAQVLDADGMDVEQADAAFGSQRVTQYLLEDFNATDVDVIPSAEPDMIAEVQKVARSNSLLQKMAAGMPLNIMEVTLRTLEAEGHEDVEALINTQPAPPPPEIVLEQQKFEWQKQMDSHKAKLSEILDREKALNLRMDSQLKFYEAQGLAVKDLHEQFMQEQNLLLAEYEAETKRMQVAQKNATETKSREAGSEASGSSGSTDAG